jgi:hypothetical protein
MAEKFHNFSRTSSYGFLTLRSSTTREGNEKTKGGDAHESLVRFGPVSHNRERAQKTIFNP